MSWRRHCHSAYNAHGFSYRAVTGYFRLLYIFGRKTRYTINDLMSDDIGVLEDITDKVLKGEIVFE